MEKNTIVVKKIQGPLYNDSVFQRYNMICLSYDILPSQTLRPLKVCGSCLTSVVILFPPTLSLSTRMAFPMDKHPIQFGGGGGGEGANSCNVYYRNRFLFGHVEGLLPGCNFTFDVTGMVIV